MKHQTGAIGALLENIGRSGIKSAYRYTYVNTGSSSGGGPDGTVVINPVDPAKCIVLVERTISTGNAGAAYSYELKATSIAVHHANWASTGQFGLAFTVVEFYKIGEQ